jgi:hypothetical protein
VTLVMGYAGATAQTTSKDASKPAADEWMLTPTPYFAWNKNISPTLRAERNKFWDDSSISPIPLRQPGSGRVTGGSYDLAFDPYEIATVPNRVVLTATFMAHGSVLTPSELSLYSEVILRVDEVFEDRSGSGHPSANHDITLILDGGTVILRSGEAFYIKNAMARPNLFIQPGHKYLLVLGYHSTGDFYEYGDSWDITDGTVRASSPRAQFFAQEGHSSLNGLSVGQLSQAVNKELYGRGAGR